MVFARQTIMDIGEAGLNLVRALKFAIKGKIDVGNTAVQIDKAGIGSLFIVSITAIFIGLAMSTQLAKELRNFGAEQFIGGLIGVAVVRELAPVIAAIVVAGRVGAAITAEIGSMKASEQIDALEVLGINPIRYLLVPRLIAAAIVGPLLTVIAALLAILSGMVLSGIVVNLSYSVYLDSVRMFIEETDTLVMMLKAMVFGGIISIIATTTGLQVSGGAEAVGSAATKTVVWSIIMIFTFNYLITTIFFGI
ncbi:MAG: hypothetical protein A2287_00925 [Candidatus Melainabacteria bacterium RIFOXYA12_FULL_32_12]|nr:MAG: hypothetical protein A2104_09550 [Candidatus Melainabacteria bacterium GWF2_32_7]OGI16824.1 MAG: hypothetical protein A2255_10310 [Candidatus Melainabacteria bacterium RIFOXYA2_FULL_32_9]OGI29737.1 MAG: hypothetical protein A2287_00925 [Candidatus Melainabacteria bacterium RIFOXYA12_FULL_32_12]